MPFEQLSTPEPNTPEMEPSERSKEEQVQDLQKKAWNLNTRFAEKQNISSDVESHKGEIDAPLTAVQIQERINEINTSIAEVEAKGMDNFSDADWDNLAKFQDELIELEKSQTALEKQETAEQVAVIEAEKQETAENADTIDVQKDKALSQFQVIKSLLSGSTAQKYPKLQNIISQWVSLLSSEKSENQISAEIKSITQEAVSYLKENHQVLAHISKDLKKQSPAKFEQFRSFLISQDSEFIPIFKQLELEDGFRDAGLGDSDISDIDGDIIRGENGEIIDMWQDIPTLSLEGEDGSEFLVGEIDKADTEKSEKEIADVQAQIKNNEHKIDQGEKRISRYDTMLQDIRGYDPKQFDAEQARQNFKNKLQNTYSEFEDMSPDIDFSESGAEFLSFLVKFVHEKRQATEKSNEVLKAENMKLQRNAGFLKAKIDSQRRLVREKMNNKKERARSSLNLLEKMAASPLTQRLKSVFARISPASPVHLENGNIITNFNLASMTFEGSFSPSLWDTGAEDFRTQETFAAMLNTAMGANIIEIGSNGIPVFRIDGQIADRMKAEAHIAEMVDDMGFESRAIENLFWGKNRNEKQNNKNG